MSVNHGHQRAYYSSPGRRRNIKSHSGMILTEETEELGEKLAPVPLFSPQISHTLTRERTRASAVTGLDHDMSRDCIPVHSAYA
jgi:hypothetical protein